MHESFLTWRRFLYPRVAAGLCAAALALYALHDPVGAPNGGTWLGYTLGALSAGLVGWLAWFGVRKRSYRAHRARAAEWLSAHVWLGLALAVVATLHSGLQVGWNVHTLAWVLTLLVIASGAWGLYVYAVYPARITANRDGATRESLVAEVAELDSECLRLAGQVGDDARDVVQRSIDATVLGGSVAELLFGDPARRAPSLQGLEDLRARLEAARAREKADLTRVTDMQQTAMGFLAAQMLNSAGGDKLETIRSLLDLIARRRALVERVQLDIRHHARMSIWLYAHVPLTVALLVALSAHVLAVFFYW